MSNVVYPAAFQRSNIMLVAEPEQPQRTAEQSALLDQAHEIVAAAIGVARAHERKGNKTAARERYLTAARDLGRLYDDHRRDQTAEILQLIDSMFIRAREVGAAGRRRWRQRPGSVVGFLGGL